MSAIFLLHHSLQQLKILFIAIRPEVQGRRYALYPFVFYGLFIFFDEALIESPGGSRGLDRVTLGTLRNLVGVKIMEAQLVEQRLLDDFMRQQEGLDPIPTTQKAERFRQIPFARTNDAATIRVLAWPWH